jgi:hypothetical protein
MISPATIVPVTLAALVFLFVVMDARHGSARGRRSPINGVASKVMCMEGAMRKHQKSNSESCRSFSGRVKSSSEGSASAMSNNPMPLCMEGAMRKHQRSNSESCRSFSGCVKGSIEGSASAMSNNPMPL